MPLKGTSLVTAAENYHLSKGKDGPTYTAQSMSCVLSCDTSPSIYQRRDSTQILSHRVCSSGVLAWLNWVSECSSQSLGQAVLTPGALTGQERTSKLIQVGRSEVPRLTWINYHEPRRLRWEPGPSIPTPKGSVQLHTCLLGVESITVPVTDT